MWHGMGGIADIFVEAVRRLLRRIERQPAAGFEIERFLDGGRRRPGVECPPLGGAGVEHGGRGKSRVGAAPQIMIEERQFDLLPIAEKTRSSAGRNAAVRRTRPCYAD